MVKMSEVVVVDVDPHVAHLAVPLDLDLPSVRGRRWVQFR